MPIAETIGNTLKGATSPDAGSAGFTIKRTQQATPWYLSIFVCPA